MQGSCQLGEAPVAFLLSAGQLPRGYTVFAKILNYVILSNPIVWIVGGVLALVCASVQFAPEVAGFLNTLVNFFL